MAEYKNITPIKEQIAHVKRNVKSENSAYLIGYISALSTVEGMIASLPAADVEPVKHSFWKNSNLYFPNLAECDVCGYEHYNTDEFKYCPNCGARMEGKEVQE